MSDIINLLADDWKKIPQNYRYLIIGGAFFIFNSWLVDHWGSYSYKYLLTIDIGLISYYVGLILIIIGFIILIGKQIFSYANVLNLRRKYPVSKIYKDFVIVSFNGKWILFDKKTKEYHHLVPWETVQDLQFVSWETYVNYGFDPNSKNMINLNNKKKIDISKYKIGGSINTRS